MYQQRVPERLPAYLKKYFWDVDVDKLNPSEKPEFVIGRLLNIGNLKGVRWVGRNFSEKQIKNTLMKSRDFSLKSASFWANIYGLPLSQVKCFQEPYRNQRMTLWPY